MSEQNTSTATDNANDRVAAALRKYDEALAEHKELTRTELSKLQRELKDALDAAAAADKREKDELRAAIKEVQDWRTEMVKKEEEKDKVKGNSTTIVTPPEDVHPPTPVEEVHHEEAYGDEEDGKRGGWRRFW